MKTYEYSVTGRNTDSRGIATIPSICSDIIDAIRKTLEQPASTQDGNRLRLMRSEFEIDERPRLDDNYNVMVSPSSDETLSGNGTVRLTDYDGHEIGRGWTWWCLEDYGEDSTKAAEKYLNAFCDMLPDDVRTTGLSVRIKLDLEAETGNDGRISYDLEEKNDESYLFTAHSNGMELCHGQLTTE